MRTFSAPGHPVLQGQRVDISTKFNFLVSLTQLMKLGIGAFVDAHNPPSFVYPGGGRDIHKVERTTDDMVRVNHLHVGRVGRIENWPGHSFTADILRSADQNKVGIVYLFVDTLPHGHVKKAASPG